MKTFLKAAAFVVGMLGAGSALAQSALVTTDLNLRAGPGTGYQSVGVLPSGAVVNVAGCASGYSWCRVNYQGYDGWASSRYLAQQEGRYAGGNFSSSAASIGIPLIAGVVIGSALSNNDRDYRRPGRYYDRRDWRADRRDWRREARRDWRDDRREWRREVRRDWRDDRRDARGEIVIPRGGQAPFRYQTD
ncbi:MULTISPECIES: SH3 domain-containing protein [Georhizobium]|jgi:uncharacterized protein YraI|uniref:SH3 domain-containing protein n=1 Tax=Georhizobium TaxID=2661800 RepID=UPI00196AA149|nr:SH3 domain-containing protein [Georhizobium profundi]